MEYLFVAVLFAQRDPVPHRVGVCEYLAGLEGQHLLRMHLISRLVHNLVYHHLLHLRFLALVFGDIARDMQIYLIHIPSGFVYLFARSFLDFFHHFFGLVAVHPARGLNFHRLFALNLVLIITPLIGWVIESFVVQKRLLLLEEGRPDILLVLCVLVNLSFTQQTHFLLLNSLFQQLLPFLTYLVHQLRLHFYLGLLLR